MAPDFFQGPVVLSRHDQRPAVRNRIAENGYRYCRISFHLRLLPGEGRQRSVEVWAVVVGYGSAMLRLSSTIELADRSVHPSLVQASSLPYWTKRTIFQRLPALGSFRLILAKFLYHMGRDSSVENAGRLPPASDNAIQRQKIQHEMARVMVVFDARGVGLESDFAVAVHGPQGIAVRTKRVFCTNVRIHPGEQLSRPGGAGVLVRQQRTDEDFLLRPQHFVQGPQIPINMVETPEDPTIDAVPGNLDMATESLYRVPENALVAGPNRLVCNHPQRFNGVPGIYKLSQVAPRTRVIVLQKFVVEIEIGIEVSVDNRVQGAVQNRLKQEVISSEDDKKLTKEV